MAYFFVLKAQNSSSIWWNNRLFHVNVDNFYPINLQFWQKIKDWSESRPWSSDEIRTLRQPLLWPSRWISMHLESGCAFSFEGLPLSYWHLRDVGRYENLGGSNSNPRPFKACPFEGSLKVIQSVIYKWTLIYRVYCHHTTKSTHKPYFLN